MSRCTTIIVGPAEHGVVRHAAAIAAAAGTLVRRARTPAALAVAPLSTPIAHWHYTDRLFAAQAPAAAATFDRWRARLGARHDIVTLHDVPDPDHPADRCRLGPYRRIAAGAEHIVVASLHEAHRLRRAGVDTPITTIALPIGPCRGAAPRPPRPARPTIGILGFVYPGKGHAELLAAGLPPGCDIVSIGTVSPGHDDLLAVLRSRAAATGRVLRITGWLDDAQLARALAAIDVPVVPATRTSASASLATWIAHGRRPLVAANAFTVELHGRADLFTLYDPHDPVAQRQGIARALAIPASTVRRGSVPMALTLPGVATAHRELYDAVAR